MLNMENLSWEEVLSAPELRAILRLEDGEAFETKDGVVWMRFVGDFEDEFKVSPHGDSRPDLESEWIARKDLKNRLKHIENNQ